MLDISQLEALLFVAGDEGMSINELSYVLSLSTEQVFEGLVQLNQKYKEDETCAIELKEYANRYMMTTKGKYQNLLQKYSQSPMAARLSQAALETLAVIAYKQPLTRMEVDQIRGVNSSASIQKLLNFQLIEEKGRLEVPGRPRIYATTDYFMDYFGLKNIDELPDISEMEADLAQNQSQLLFKEITEEEERTPDSLEQE
ncbi:SMC-Scp complex subunit ScpB [Enterococcus cecorum]|uniref:Segregation and condensation protein B n=2 Tax=Enterococcus cecorum TaxID=44008 RepID=A0AAW9JME7_9ENTE|nr:SMC-Scp complex subunit ScpB [Enterococcus cecorum]MBM6936620.1 SMC-Scp complex subunit ScpB [Enterococcus cecorum]MDY2955511.1 SMC-Scp complex subunit ScpB [Enterococcus cecorum]MDZ5439351.1 SMC-Scp complex subunit ScpB [Enterococcus cecorum]MDZ5497360.1 SMC-Scp complex subunit ScpB [Enterococcus cecorum]MDZ5503355.1 SMC-Scp complex subunit ScpB [Enterococcus cecorum]